MIHFHLGEFIPNLTDWIQAIAALILVVIGAFSYRLAKRELYKWKEQRDDGIIRKGLSHTQKSYQYIFLLRNSQIAINEVSEDLIPYTHEGRIPFVVRTESRRRFHKDTIEKAILIYEELYTVLESNHVLVQFYEYILMLDTEIFNLSNDADRIYSQCKNDGIPATEEYHKKVKILSWEEGDEIHLKLDKFRNSIHQFRESRKKL